MRKLTILALIAAPLSAFGAYALASEAQMSVSSDNPIVVNESDKTDMAAADDAKHLVGVESEGGEQEAGPLLKNGSIFGDSDGNDGDSDD
jgi:hypothetical protein